MPRQTNDSGSRTLGTEASHMINNGNKIWIAKIKYLVSNHNNIGAKETTAGVVGIHNGTHVNSSHRHKYEWILSDKVDLSNKDIDLLFLVYFILFLKFSHVGYAGSFFTRRVFDLVFLLNYNYNVYRSCLLVCLLLQPLAVAFLPST